MRLEAAEAAKIKTSKFLFWKVYTIYTNRVTGANWYSGIGRFLLLCVLFVYDMSMKVDG